MKLELKLAPKLYPESCLKYEMNYNGCDCNNCIVEMMFLVQTVVSFHFSVFVNWNRSFWDTEIW